VPDSIEARRPVSFPPAGQCAEAARQAQYRGQQQGTDPSLGGRQASWDHSTTGRLIGERGTQIGPERPARNLAVLGGIRGWLRPDCSRRAPGALRCPHPAGASMRIPKGQPPAQEHRVELGQSINRRQQHAGWPDNEKMATTAHVRPRSAGG